MNVFIDTQIYLRLFHPPGDEYKYIGKLKELIKSNKIKIIFPQITRNEVYRNIDSFSGDPKKDLKDVEHKEPKLPNKLNPEEKEMIQKANKEFVEVIEKVKDSYISRRSSAIRKMIDVLFGEYSDISSDIFETEAQTQKAIFRKAKGYPPGKDAHIGDELVWEILIETCIDDDLVIITSDSDWTGREDGEIHPLLEKEWKANSKKSISFYTSLGEFLANQGYKGEITPKRIEEEKIRPSLENIEASLSLSPSANASLPSAVYTTLAGSVSPSASAYTNNILNDYFGTSQASMVPKICRYCGASWIGYSVIETCPLCNKLT